MDVERLIECVRRHVFLFDLSHKEFRNTGLKAAIWESIARELNQNCGSVVRHKWKTVKDGYLKYKKLLKGTTGAARQVTDYVWKSQLMFLDNYNVTRQTTSNIRSQAQFTCSTSQLQPSEESHDSTGTSPPPSTSLILPPSISATSPPSVVSPWSQTRFDLPAPSMDAPTTLAPSTLVLSTPAPPRHLSTNEPQHGAKRKRSDDNENEVDKIINYLNERKNKHAEAVDLLFKSYAETFRKLSFPQQAHLKIELAKLFANAELTEIRNAANSRL